MRLTDLAAAAAGGAAMYHFGAALEVSALRDIVGTVAQISGTLLGFVAAAIAILLAIPDTKFTRNLQRTGHMQHLLGQMYWAAVWSLGVVVTSVVSMFLYADLVGLGAIAVIAFLSAALFRLALAGRRFYMILDVFAEARRDERLE